MGTLPAFIRIQEQPNSVGSPQNVNLQQPFKWLFVIGS